MTGIRPSVDLRRLVSRMHRLHRLGRSGYLAKVFINYNRRRTESGR